MSVAVIISVDKGSSVRLLVGMHAVGMLETDSA